MECKECQGLVSEYLSGQLKGKRLEHFISHVRSCPECYDELETYFIITLANRILENEEDASFDIKGLLEEDLAQKEQCLHRKRRRKAFFGLLLLILLAVDILLTLHFLGIFPLGGIW